MRENENAVAINPTFCDFPRVESMFNVKFGMCPFHQL